MAEQPLSEQELAQKKLQGEVAEKMRQRELDSAKGKRLLVTLASYVLQTPGQYPPEIEAARQEFWKTFGGANNGQATPNVGSGGK